MPKSLQIDFKQKSFWLAIGSERGWAEKEREFFYKQGFQFVTLGNRILRTETACIAAISYILTKTNHY